MAELYYERNKWLLSTISLIVAVAVFISFVIFRPVEAKALAIPVIPTIVVGIIVMLFVLWGINFNSVVDSSNSLSWNTAELVAEDFVRRVEAADNPVYDHYLEQIYNMESMVVDETFSSVEVSTELVDGFGTMVEDLYDVNLNLQESLSTSLSVGTRYVMPLNSSLTYNADGQPNYILGDLIDISSLVLGMNLIYSSDIASLYFYKTDTNYLIPVFKIGDYYVRKGSISSISGYESISPMCIFGDSSGNVIELSSFLGTGYGYYHYSSGTSLSGSYSRVSGRIIFYFTAINSGVPTKYLSIELALNSSSGLYASKDLSSVIEYVDYLDYEYFKACFDNFESEYIGNYLNKVSLSLGDLEIVDYVFPFCEPRKITESEFMSQILFHLLNWSLGFTDTAIGSLTNESFDVVIDSDYLTGEDRYIDAVITSGDTITLKVPTDIGSLSDAAEGSGTVAIPVPSEIVIDDSDVDTDVDTDDGSGDSGSGSSDSETLVIPDIDTGGILHYVEAFLSGISPFFVWLGSLIMALPTELVVIVLGGLVICLIVGFLSLII